MPRKPDIDISKLDPVRLRLYNRINDLKLTLKEVSLACGKSHSYIQQFLQDYTPAVLKEEMRENIARLLDMNPDDLKPKAQNSISTSNNIKNLNKLSASKKGFDIPEYASDTSLHTPKVRGDHLPVYGRETAEGFIMDFNTPQGHVARPEQLDKQQDAYAVYVPDNTMAPAYRTGRLVYVDPKRLADEGDEVLIVMPDSKAFIRIVKAKQGTRLVLEQLNPPQVTEMDLKEIKFVHVIILAARVKM